jgi:hypothetical protein
MKTRVLKAIPEVFSLRGNDYGRFVVKGGAAQMMRDSWAGVGAHMSQAVAKVGAQVVQQNKKATGNVHKKEGA